jgi:hypothetical protein
MHTFGDDWPAARQFGTLFRLKTAQPYDAV